MTVNVPKVVVVTGPTATGKTHLGAMLAKAIGSEVISADSMQIYKNMDIGTAKPSEEEMLGVPHHLLGFVSPMENYSAARFVEEASAKADDIIGRGMTPVIVGGTGLYIESLISGRDFAPRQEDGDLRRQLEEEYDDLGGETMLKKLAEYDALRAEILHPNDKKRIVRALEICMCSGEAMSSHDERTKSLLPRYDAAVIVLNYADRADLYERIDKRVDVMFARGLVDEVRGLMADGVPVSATALQAIGYKEIVRALNGEIGMGEASELIKRSSRRYAKRQISWCNRYKDALRINWKKIPDFEEAQRVSTEFLRISGVI